MTNRKDTFIVFFVLIFFLSASLISAVQYKDQGQIDLSFALRMSLLLAIIGSAIGAGVLPSIPKFESTTPKLPLTALRVMVIAIITACLGGGLAFLGFLSIGRIIAVVGILTGNLMMLIIFADKVVGLFNKSK